MDSLLAAALVNGPVSLPRIHMDQETALVNIMPSQGNDCRVA